MINACLPKEFGGAGISNTKRFNEALLLRWVWRIYASSADDSCCNLLKAKYLKNKPLLNEKKGKGSQLWKGVNKIKHNFCWGATFVVRGAFTGGARGALAPLLPKTSIEIKGEI